GRRQARLGEDFADLFPVHGSTVPNLARLAIAAALLRLGASWVVRGAVGLGPVLGMEALVLGLLPAAIGTALPDAAAAIGAAGRGEGVVVAGHVLGSRRVCLLLVVGGLALARDVQVPAWFGGVEVRAALGLGALLLPMLRGGLEVSRAEGAVLLGAFLAWV